MRIFRSTASIMVVGILFILAIYEAICLGIPGYLVNFEIPTKIYVRHTVILTNLGALISASIVLMYYISLAYSRNEKLSSRKWNLVVLITCMILSLVSIIHIVIINPLIALIIGIETIMLSLILYYEKPSMIEVVMLIAFLTFLLFEVFLFSKTLMIVWYTKYLVSWSNLMFFSIDLLLHSAFIILGMLFFIIMSKARIQRSRFGEVLTYISSGISKLNPRKAYIYMLVTFLVLPLYMLIPLLYAGILPLIVSYNDVERVLSYILSSDIDGATTTVIVVNFSPPNSLNYSCNGVFYNGSLHLINDPETTSSLLDGLLSYRSSAMELSSTIIFGLLSILTFAMLKKSEIYGSGAFKIYITVFIFVTLLVASPSFFIYHTLYYSSNIFFFTTSSGIAVSTEEASLLVLLHAVKSMLFILLVPFSILTGKLSSIYSSFIEGKISSSFDTDVRKYHNLLLHHIRTVSPEKHPYISDILSELYGTVTVLAKHSRELYDYIKECLTLRKCSEIEYKKIGEFCNEYSRIYSIDYLQNIYDVFKLKDTNNVNDEPKIMNAEIISDILLGYYNLLSNITSIKTLLDIHSYHQQDKLCKSIVKNIFRSYYYSIMIILLVNQYIQYLSPDLYHEKIRTMFTTITNIKLYRSNDIIKIIDMKDKDIAKNLQPLLSFDILYSLTILNNDKLREELTDILMKYLKNDEYLSSELKRLMNEYIRKLYDDIIRRRTIYPRYTPSQIHLLVQNEIRRIIDILDKLLKEIY